MFEDEHKTNVVVVDDVFVVFVTDIILVL